MKGPRTLHSAPLWAWVRAIARRLRRNVGRGALASGQALGTRRPARRSCAVRAWTATIFRPEMRSAGAALGDTLRGDRGLLRQFFLPKSHTLLIGVGRSCGREALGRLARWVRTCARTSAPVALAIFGDGPEREVIASARPRIGPDAITLGFETDRPRLAGALASGDLFVHACPFETFGLSVAEALACGTPAVVPDRRQRAAELVDASSGAHYRTWDPTDAFARAALELLARCADSAEPSEFRAACVRGVLACRAPNGRGVLRSCFARFYEELLGIDARPAGCASHVAYDNDRGACPRVDSRRVARLGTRSRPCDRRPATAEGGC